MAFHCLPASTRKLFESSAPPDFPSVKDLLTFVQSRVAILEIAGDYQKRPNNRSQLAPHSNAFTKKTQMKLITTSLVVSKSSGLKGESCPNYNGKHAIVACRQFLSLSVEDRNHWAREHGVCYTYLSNKHWVNKCPSQLRRETYSKKHHTLLHGFSTRRKSDNASSNGDASLFAAAMSARSDDSLVVLLGTTLVHIRDHCGTWQTVCALIDSVFQISAITVSCSNRFGLQMKNWTTPISGLSSTTVVDVRGTTKVSHGTTITDEGMGLAIDKF